MKFFLLISILFVTELSWAQTFEWAMAVGGDLADQGVSVTTDPLGNVITLGVFEGVVDFDPGVGVENFTSFGSSDVFIQKMGSDGNFIWAKSFGSSSIDRGYSVVTDDLGNIYSTGYFNGTVDFDPGPDVHALTSSGINIFVHKLDADGNFLWAKSFGSIYGDIGFSVTVDPLSNVVITGNFTGTVDFDPGVEVYSLSAEPGTTNFFILKLNTDGDFIWANTSDGGEEETLGNSVITDELGNVHVTGWFTGTIDFDPGLGVSFLTSDYRDIFVCKYDEDGNFLWAKSFGGDGWDLGSSIDVDAFGNIYTTGGFHGTVDFDPGIGASVLTAIEEGAFIHKMDVDGDFLWVKSLDGIGRDRAVSVSISDLGYIFTTGIFSFVVDSDPGPVVHNLISEGNTDIFIQKLDASGDFLWAHSMGGTGVDFGSSIRIDELENSYITGFFNGTVDFDPIDGGLNLTSEGSSDIFIHKLGGCANTGIDVISSCDSYTWIDGNVYEEDTFGPTFLLMNMLGCDSIVTLDFTLESSESIDEITACDSLIWTNGVTYYSDNFIATDTFTNIAGCDSVVTLNLTVHYRSEGIHTITSCDSYTWIDGETYTEDNSTATYTLTNEAGCDSLITLNLTVHNIDLTVIIEGLTLTVVEPSAEYQWLDCLNDFEPIPGADEISFAPEENGEYAVIITKYGCSDTSDCAIISTIGIANTEIGSVNIYPNPTLNDVEIRFEKELKNVSLDLKDIEGRLIFTKNFGELKNTTLDIPESSGVYILAIRTEQSQTVIKIIKR